MKDKMVQINIEYLGDLHCIVQHEPSKQEFTTDAPTDNRGKGEYFSPTDLLASAVGSCIATIMGIKAQDKNIDIKGTKITVNKEMIKEPCRRVGKLIIDVAFPYKLSVENLQILKNVIKSCPVTKSLHPDIEIVANYTYPE